MNLKLPLVLFSLAVSTILLLNSSAIAQNISRDFVIYKYDGSKFVQVPGALSDIAVGADGTVWGLGNPNGNGNIWKYNGNDFVQVPGALDKIAVGNKDNVWGLNRDGLIYKYDGSNFQQVPGKLRDIAVGADDTVWGLNSNKYTDNIYRWDGN
ncbi:MAG: tectonin domain-containing protein, partial [Candidatus Nitrosocosmicus sp.]